MIDGGTALAVTNSANTAVSIANGGAIIQAARYDLTAGPLVLAVATNAAGSNRFDIVCLTYDATHSPVVYLRIVQGTAGAGLPALTNSASGVWDFPIAHYEKQTGTNLIINIRDRRKFADGAGQTVGLDDTTGTLGVGWFPPAPRIGQVQRFWPSGNSYVWDGTAWSVNAVTLWHSADQTVNNNATLVNITGLSAPLAATGKYVFESFIVYDSVTNVPDMKIAVNCPAAATMHWVPNGLDPTSTTRVGAIDFRDALGAGFFTTGTTGGSLQTIISPKGIVRTGGTAGTLDMQFAQSTATAENTVLRADSYMRVTRIG
jgi:hypothetical protein